ncbi:hypothetical protein U2261_10525 [Achromobacter xylosoxidans]|uniref:hypothetical protein n=1 Tax=Alcaligenes xylosoxydans xylosoxydans TaxID=85698 RepID=UPI002AC9F274|nr:hypothetical protein [Achromobacter xylosoxidans]MDZ5615043.1 hypothetical protein [Achromobacter xylosoxidans]MDZ5625753.1 hypothetical protein [Achromobacter xylosoxidans]MDZ5685320.1 hypothetical protein [Achromobacter xylosoxidans]
MTTTIPARDWELTCHECDGSGHVYVKHQVAERKTDIQEFKEECECCEGRGFVFAFQDIPGIEEYVKTCRHAPAAPGVSTVEAHREYGSPARILRQFLTVDGFIAECDIPEICARLRPAPAAGDALDAARYRQLRKALTSYDTGWLDRIATALEAMGLDPDEDKLPTPEQVDSAFDAAQRKGDA